MIIEDPSWHQSPSPSVKTAHNGSPYRAHAVRRAAVQGMSHKDAVVTILRGLSVAAITFLVASGFSIIFGLMDVLNLAHGTLFMIGAYVGWTAYVRPDTVVGVMPLLLILLAGFLLTPVWVTLLANVSLGRRWMRLLPWVLLALAILLLALSLSNVSISMWNAEVYDDSPIVWTQRFQAGQIQEMLALQPDEGGTSPLVWSGILLGSMTLAGSVAAFSFRNRRAAAATRSALSRSTLTFVLTVLIALALFVLAGPIAAFLFGLGSGLTLPFRHRGGSPIGHGPWSIDGIHLDSATL